MRDQQSSDTSIALDANTDVQQEADKPVEVEVPLRLPRLDRT